MWRQPNNGVGVKVLGISLWSGSKSGFWIGNGAKGGEGTPGEDIFEPNMGLGTTLNKSYNESIVDWKGRCDGSGLGTIGDTEFVFNGDNSGDGKQGWNGVFEAIKVENKILHTIFVRIGLLGILVVFVVIGLIVEANVKLADDVFDNDSLGGFESDNFT